MANSYVRYTGTGAQVNFSLTFPYLDPDHVSVLVDGVPVSFSWVNATTVAVAPAPASGAVVEVRRDTPADAPLVDFQDGAIVTEEQLDENARQSLYIAQEGKDSLLGIPDLVARAEAAAEAAADSAANAPPGFSSVLYAGAYGVTANGVTDDTEALQDAVDAAVAASAELRLPPGTIRTGTINFTNLCKMRGAGFGTVIVPLNDAIGTIFNVTGNYVEIADMQIDGSAITSPTLTGIYIDSGGLTKVQRLWIIGMGVGIDVPQCNAGEFESIRIQACPVCVRTGGVSGKFPGDITWRNIVAIPTTAGTGLLIDGNTNAQDFGNFKTIGGDIGVNFRGAGSGTGKPDGNFFTTGNFTAAVSANVQILKAMNTWFSAGTSIGGATAGHGVYINPASAADVDGIFICDAQVRGNFKNGINWNSGANLFLLNSQVYGNSNGGGSGVYSNVRVGASTTGTFYVDDLMAGLSSTGNLLANVQGPAKYGIELVSGSLSDTVNFPGRVMIDGLFALGNVTGEISDASTPTGSNKYIRMKAASDQPIWTTGDVKLTWKTTADAGWIMHTDGTIGNVSSGATYANNAAEALFILIWTNFSNSLAAVSSGRGVSAAADWAANKTIALPKALGRSIGVAGAGSGLTSRTLGSTTGAETVSAEMPSHTHSAKRVIATTSVQPYDSGTAVEALTAASFDDGGATGAAASGDGTMSVMQPTSFWNVMVKL